MIEAKIILDSVNGHNGKRVTTFELDYPRYIHAEVMTHRVFSRNAQSSRAVPVSSMVNNNENFVKPLVYGANKSGMSSSEELKDEALEFVKLTWDNAAHDAFNYSKVLSECGLHKQWANRITEPFSHIKVIVTSTEYDNFFWLRCDPEAAQPEIVTLADKMFNLYQNSVPLPLYNKEWHLPYLKRKPINGVLTYFDSAGTELTLEEAVKISASCCAQVSYRRLNDSKEKALEIYEKLFSGPKPHLSPTEHQAMAYRQASVYLHTSEEQWLDGITHKTRNGDFYSGNLNGFIQYRQII